ncbi:putative 2-dehydropantoate 2-reductase [Erysiphe necator]|nr:putative 2-dehydropantoate 2-reductase [Erysiphe necator]
MSLAAKRIHVLGLGNLGCFFAHCLRQADRITPITLLFHRESLYKDWDNAFQRISITTTEDFINDISYQNNNRASLLSSTSDPTTSISSAFDIESTFSTNSTISTHSSEGANNYRSNDESPIYNLVLATKSFQTLDALSSIKHRLTDQSSILFVQNGLGIIPEINQVLFPDILTRPSYLVSLVSHGLYSSGPFKSILAGPGRVIFGHISKPSPMSSALVDVILDTLMLNASYFDHLDIRNFQMEKLVVNAIINPLSALFRCENGKLFWVGTNRILVRSLMKRLISEINQVFVRLDGLNGPLDPDRFAVGNMESMVTGIARKTRNNLSSMLQDVLHHGDTEIDYINGWIVSEGEKKGIDVRCNKKLIELVKKREKLTEDLIELHFPGTITRKDMNAWTQALEGLRLNGIKDTKKPIFNQTGLCLEAW